MLLITKGYGFTVDDIDWSSPADLEPYSKAYNLHMQQQDYMAWVHNQYTLSAVAYVIEHSFAGKKARSEYVKAPFLANAQSKKEEISEEKRVEMENYKLAMSLQVMQANFEINKKRN